MGRGRSGTVEQGMKKPKISKDKEMGADFQLFQRHSKQAKSAPILLSEDFLAEMKKMSRQNLMNTLLPNQCENGNLRQNLQ